MSDWSPGRYLAFEDERTQPARDLLARVPLNAPRHVFDIGCGPGNSTALLSERWPQATVVGVDSSPAMLAEARQRLPACRFVEADVAGWRPGTPPDVIFANAVLQWVPDHLAVMTRLIAGLAPGGFLAVQMPDNLAEPSHTIMREVAASGPWRSKFAAPIVREAIASVPEYMERLATQGMRLGIWHTVYYHPLADAGAIVDWVRGTGLRPFLDRLDGTEQAAFLATYRDRVAGAYPPLADGRVLFRFPRLFVVARAPA